MNIESDINFGPRLKKQRISKGFSQAELSKTIGISASYLNLIESGKRKIPLSLLIKAADKLDLSIKDFSTESSKRLLSDVMDVLSNEIFDDLKITNHDTSDFIGSNPNIAKALLTINDSFKSFKEDMQNRLETMDVNANQIEKPTRLPVEIVSDILQENKNYFHDLEISFNSRYLIDVASQLEGEKIEIFLNDTGSPALIKDPSDIDSIYVVMPMKG